MALSTHRWTRADLERLPDDGNKYEVIHGELFVTPAPRPAHDYIALDLARRLSSFCASLERLEVFRMAAFIDGDSEAIPDIVVGERVMPPPEKWDDMPTPVLERDPGVLDRRWRSANDHRGEAG